MDNCSQPFGAAIFDLDGVVTNTAEAHFQAWKSTFDAFLRQHGAGDGGPFTRDEYLQHVDGVPRRDGVVRWLAARGITLNEGEPGDTSLTTVAGIAGAKNAAFVAWLSREQVPVFDDATALIEAFRAAGVPVGLYSASRNAKQVLKSAGVDAVFDTVVDGDMVAELGLAPKPEPGQLIETARRLGAEPATTVVIEDAISGVQAGDTGHFGLVIGINRRSDNPGAHRHALRANGADIVTSNLQRFVSPTGSGLKTIGGLPSAWDALAGIEESFAGRPLAVFLDYDGTLSGIVEDYRKAFLPDETGEALRQLSAKCPVAIISGRDRQDVKDRVGLDNVYYSGSHGFDTSGPGGLHEIPERVKPFLSALNDIAPALEAALAGYPGGQVERKAFSIAVHYRQVAQGLVGPLIAQVDETLHAFPQLKKSHGKMVLEIKPDTDWDKGKAILWLLENTAIGNEAVVPIYVGDDLTDEDAFDALPEDALRLVVRGGRHLTLADYALEDPTDVRRFLSWLAERPELS